MKDPNIHDTLMKRLTVIFVLNSLRWPFFLLNATCWLLLDRKFVGVIGGGARVGLG
jgi:hypothetical protein